MMRKKVATIAVAVTFTAGAALPAGATAKKATKAKAAPSLISQTCSALGLDKVLEGLDVALNPLVRVKLYAICKD